jgi:sirohydrochlorin cobaltochelatase
LVGHGTRDELGTAQFFELEKRLAERLVSIPVQAALLEFQRPTIPEAWNTLVGQGAEHIDVAPLLLFAAGHAKRDIPDIIEACQATTPFVSFTQSRPLSRHRSIIDLVAGRLNKTLVELGTAASRTAVVMVGRGNHDPCAQADMRVLSEVVGRRIDVPFVATAFYAMAQPRLCDLLGRVAASGRFDAVVVHPHLLFEGRLHQGIRQQTAEAAATHPAVRFVTSPYLGPDPLVANAIAARIDRGSVAPSANPTG